MQVLKVREEDSQLRLDVYLTQNLSYAPSRSYVQKMIESGYVSINELRAKANHKVSAGDDVCINAPDNFDNPNYVAPENIPLNIFYEDEQLIIINKPVGLMVHPTSSCKTGTLVNALLHHAAQLSNVNSDMRPGIVHRLDKETSGLIIVAKDNITHTKLAKQFQRHLVNKKYVALVDGLIEFDEGKINVPIGAHTKHHEKKMVRFDESAKEAMTIYRVIQRGANGTLVALYPKTGRTHQLRVHMKHLGHPILGDEKYGNKLNFPRLALHAKSIGFVHPKTKSYVEFSTPTPELFFKKVQSKLQV